MGSKYWKVSNVYLFRNVSRIMLKIFSVILVIAFLPSCSSTPCAPGDLRFGLVGFSDTEAGDIIIRRYPKGNNFINKLDSVIVQAGFRRSNDTLELTSLNGNAAFLSVFDYEMVFNQAGRVYRITNIHEEFKEQKNTLFHNTKELCKNAIADITINGQLTNTIDSYKFYVVK